MALNLKTETVFTGDTSATQPPLPPEQLAPHFPQLEILECLGRGGMGVVYKARQKSLNRLVALKLLAPERVTDAKFAERFTREAHALAALNHPHIVTIHDFGRAGGFYFLLMEFVDGVNLRQLLTARRLRAEEALAIVPPLCDALQYAHEQGIVHRDIKPANLLLDKAGRVKIADFGIAKMVGDNSGVEVAESQPAGTPQYMAPEQKVHQRTDHRADIYSLGVVLYEMLTGELPADKLQPPSRKVQIDVRLDEIVLRALERTPELRFATAAEFRTQVEAVTDPSGAPLNATHTSAKSAPKTVMAAMVVAVLFGLLLIGIPFVAWLRVQTKAEAVSNALFPVIEKVEITKDRAVVHQRHFDGEGMILAFGASTNLWTPAGVYLEAMFDITLEPHRIGRGADWVVKLRRGSHSSYRLDAPSGPMLGKVAFHPGMPARETNDSYIIGEFRSENAEPLPIVIRLEKSRELTASSKSGATPQCEVNLRNAGEMKDKISNVLIRAENKPEPEVQVFLKDAHDSYATGDDLLKAAAEHFKIDQKRLAALVEYWRHINCQHAAIPGYAVPDAEREATTGETLTPVPVGGDPSTSPQEVMPQVPPYSSSVVGTDFDFITESDPNTFDRLEDKGSGPAEMPDKSDRSAPLVQEAFLFVAHFNDGTRVRLAIDADFQTQASARQEALRYTPRLGKLPTALRRGVERVVIHKGGENVTAFSDVGLIVLYADNATKRIGTHDLEETVFHESVHAAWDKTHAKSAEWQDAQKKDGGYVTDYARKNPKGEDLAESALFAYTLLHHPNRIPNEEAAKIARLIPNRIAFVEKLLPKDKPLHFLIEANP